MGTAKQLLPWGDTTLIRHAARCALAVEVADVFVVVGAEREAVVKELTGLNVRIIYHSGYAGGLGSSLAAGATAVTGATPDGYTHVLVQLADQPAVTAPYLKVLLREAAVQDTLVATAYPGRPGVPAVFPARYVAELRALGGDAGAGKVLRAAGEAVHLIHPPFDLFDLDTPEDYRRHEGDS